ncbi:prolyl-tRNA editing enzyme YbaK/EbsC (Cys-tRNA(Pro) deacylase) [Nocardiopsis sp. Huas11]|uniref:YbaK/EbsC family protein n=1 Tax=Nocardiopsis sp. Huas11 TaxID=2183912 RepID=UPI000EAC578E|nr:YbaK/EbsC family protein [Nocardiopsis sp. Huas11]RKS09402.1 prolyl-tRNA editing enzyme YbaK/EbsC (Cys-tRNA(Pro) deacylase) [Nocardiopsis sp. Huas11]
MAEGTELPERSRRVVEALDRFGSGGRVRELPASTRTARAAAETLGCEVGAIANSLVFMADERPLLVMTSGRHRVDTALLAERLGKGTIRRAEPEEVRAATGQAIGGVAPVGHPAPVETVVDASLADYERLWAAAGTPNTIFPTDFAELVKMTGGTPVAVN